MMHEQIQLLSNAIGRKISKYAIDGEKKYLLVIANGFWEPGSEEDKSRKKVREVAEKRAGEDNGTVEARKFLNKGTASDASR